MIVKSFIPLILLLPMCIAYLDPITAVGGLAVSAIAYAIWQGGKCIREECCANNWINWDDEGFRRNVTRSFHGQHLAKEFVDVLRNHFANENSHKALVLSFNGPTGSGKNFFSKLIAEHLYNKGMKSKFVHTYIATQHFPHAYETRQYRKQLEMEVLKSIQACKRSLFIFDEMDKMPDHVIDVLKPYMDHTQNKDYTKGVYIFLSNSGGEEISKVALKSWQDFKDRSKITKKDMLPIKASFHNTGGLKNSLMVRQNLINAYVPFLPLEKQHVELCIKDELKSRSMPIRAKMVEDIANELDYFPPDLQLFSVSGCKKISQKIDMYDENDDW